MYTQIQNGGVFHIAPLHIELTCNFTVYTWCKIKLIFHFGIMLKSWTSLFRSRSYGTKTKIPKTRVSKSLKPD